MDDMGPSVGGKDGGMAIRCDYACAVRFEDGIRASAHRHGGATGHQASKSSSHQRALAPSVHRGVEVPEHSARSVLGTKNQFMEGSGFLNAHK